MKESLSITEQLTMRLLQELRNGCYQGCNRLPPEQDISNFFGSAVLWSETLYLPWSARALSAENEG